MMAILTILTSQHLSSRQPTRKMSRTSAQKHHHGSLAKFGVVTSDDSDSKYSKGTTIRNHVKNQGSTSHPSYTQIAQENRKQFQYNVRLTI
jgi:uncharacterized cupredoxin-like copper-binding protein